MDIFTLKKELEATASHEQIMVLMKREMGKLGVKEWGYVFQVIEMYEFPGGVCMNNFRPEWFAHYMENAYFTVDPLFRYFRSSIEPLFWSVEDDWRGYGPGTVAFQEDLRSWGYWGGVCIPIQTMDATHGLINLVTNSHDVEVIDKAVKVAFLMRYVHSHTLRLWIEQYPGHTSLRARLSPREKEILRAVADGLTSQEIGKKLHLSNRTVDSHLTAVQEKLHAGNRQQALCKAVNLGMIHAPLQFNPEHIIWINGSFKQFRAFDLE